VADSVRLGRDGVHFLRGRYFGGCRNRISAGLFSRRARALLVPAGLAFLVGIRILMGPAFEQFMMCYVLRVPWQRVLAYNPWRHAFASSRGWSRPADVPAGADSELAAGH